MYSQELHWRFAAQWAGLDFESEFLEKDGLEQSRIVAAYETSLRIPAVLNKAAQHKPAHAQPKEVKHGA